MRLPAALDTLAGRAWIAARGFPRIAPLLSNRGANLTTALGPPCPISRSLPPMSSGFVIFVNKHRRETAARLADHADAGTPIWKTQSIDEYVAASCSPWAAAHSSTAMIALWMAYSILRSGRPFSAAGAEGICRQHHKKQIQGTETCCENMGQAHVDQCAKSGGGCARRARRGLRTHRCRPRFFGLVDTPDYTREKIRTALVPVIEGRRFFVLWESNCHRGAPNLGRAVRQWQACVSGRSARGRAGCRPAGLDWQATTFNPLVGPIFWNLIRYSAEGRATPRLSKTSRAGGGKENSRCSMRSWSKARIMVAGSSFTMGDIPRRLLGGIAGTPKLAARAMSRTRMCNAGMQRLPRAAGFTGRW